MTLVYTVKLSSFIETLHTWPRHNCRYSIFTALLVPIPLSTLKSHIWASCSACLSSLKKTGNMQASPSKNIVLTGTPVYRYLPLSQEREFKPFMEMRCVRPLKCGEQLEVWSPQPLHAFQNLNTEIRFPFQIKVANDRTTSLSSHLLDA
jgi:hypothetical protein